MSNKDSNITIRESLKSNIKFRSFIDQIRVSECEIGSQSQSPDISFSGLKVRILNADYLSKTELIFLCYLTYYLNTTTLKYSCPHLLVELLTQLPEKIERSTFLKNQEKIELWKLFSRSKLYFTNNWPFPPREILGILSDRQVMVKITNRLYQRVRPQSSRLKRTQRIRGYRDHGTLRPSHQWKPTSDYTLTELQNHIEEERKRLRRYAQLAITGKNPVAVEDFPNLFDK